MMSHFTPSSRPHNLYEIHMLITNDNPMDEHWFRFKTAAENFHLLVSRGCVREKWEEAKRYLRDILAYLMHPEIKLHCFGARAYLIRDSAVILDQQLRAKIPDLNAVYEAWIIP